MNGTNRLQCPLRVIFDRHAHRRTAEGRPEARCRAGSPAAPASRTKASRLRWTLPYRARIGIPKDVRDDYEALRGRRWEELFHRPASLPLSKAKADHSEWVAGKPHSDDTRQAARRGTRPNTASSARVGRRMVSMVHPLSRREPRPIRTLGRT
jgi:hypothetical protein